MRRPQLTVSPGFWLLLAGFWFLDEWGLLPPFLLAGGLHEAAHLGARALLDVPVWGLELRADGAVIRAELEGRGREALAVMAGPCVNLLCAGLCYRLWPVFSFYSFVLFLYNLLPVRPLDGGRLCRLVLPRMLGRCGEILCQLLHWGTLAAALVEIRHAVLLGRALFPAMPAVFFLLRLPMGLDKRGEGW